MLRNNRDVATPRRRQSKAQTESDEGAIVAEGLATNEKYQRQRYNTKVVDGQVTLITVVQRTRIKSMPRRNRNVHQLNTSPCSVHTQLE